MRHRLLVVLSEAERCAKRALIARNRERKELERIRARVRHATTRRFVDDHRPLINELTSAYCNRVDVPLELDARADPAEQYTTMVATLLSRTFNFAMATKFFSDVGSFSYGGSGGHEKGGRDKI